MNDELLLQKFRARVYPMIPQDKFDEWARDPFGQEKIDAYVEQDTQRKIREKIDSIAGDAR